MNYYNEHDPKAAAWLRELISWRHRSPPSLACVESPHPRVPPSSPLW